MGALVLRLGNANILSFGVLGGGMICAESEVDLGDEI